MQAALSLKTFERAKEKKDKVQASNALAKLGKDASPVTAKFLDLLRVRQYLSLGMLKEAEAVLKGFAPFGYEIQKSNNQLKRAKEREKSIGNAKRDIHVFACQHLARAVAFRSCHALHGLREPMFATTS